MKKLAPIAALLVAASGALAQSECEKSCESEKEAKVQAVQLVNAEECEAACETACEGVAVQTVAATKTGECCESQKAETVQLVNAASDDCATACSSTTTQTVSLTSDDCASACSSTATQTVSLTSDDCASSCTDKAQGQAVQLVAFPTDMPQMTYVVGEKETRCSVEAGQLASACDTLKVQYKVHNVVFADQAAAGKAYADDLHAYLDRVTRVSFVVGESCTMCPVEAQEMASACDSLKVQYKVGNTVFDCAEKAIMASAMAYGMAQHTQLTRAINGEATSCDASFKSAQACSQTKATYLVNGRETECSVEADCMLTTARIEAALAAAQQVAGS